MCDFLPIDISLYLRNGARYEHSYHRGVNKQARPRVSMAKASKPRPDMQGQGQRQRQGLTSLSFSETLIETRMWSIEWCYLHELA